MICQHFVPWPPTKICKAEHCCFRTDWNSSQNCGFLLKIPQRNKWKNQNKISMGPFRDSCALSCLSESRTDVPAYTPPPSHRPECVPLISPADELKLQSLKIDGCGPSSVIKIVKMKYNRIDIKMRLVSTWFKIHIKILSNYRSRTWYSITNYFTQVFIFSCTSKRSLSNSMIQLTCNAVSTYWNHIRIFLLFTRWGGGGMIYQVHQSVLFSCWAEVAIVDS